MMITATFAHEISILCFFCGKRSLGGILVNRTPGKKFPRVGLVCCDSCAVDLETALQRALDQTTPDVVEDQDSPT